MAQITLNQIDTFETGTTLGWGNGQGTSGITVPTGGPGGSGDHYLRFSSGGSAPPHLVVFNRSQWLGNYNTAGVNAIEMDLQNFSATLLAVRIGFRESTGGSSTPGYVTATPVSLPADGQWHHAVFQLNIPAMTPVNSPSQSRTALLSNPAEVRILSATTASLNGDAITGALGVDNIHAIFIPVPESAHVLGVLLAVGGLARLRGWRRKPAALA
jgi:hypothetical protein